MSCLNCGTEVPSRYIELFTPGDFADPRVCPYCDETVSNQTGSFDTHHCH